jgi:hypothetical protein
MMGRRHYVSAAMALWCATGAMAYDSRPLSEVQLNDGGGGIHIKLPANAPRPVLYTVKGGKGQSCGLLTKVKGVSRIMPILEPREDDDRPNCFDVSAAMSLRWKGKPVWVYRFLQSDVEHESYPVDVFVQRSGDDFAPIALFSATDSQSDKTAPFSAALGKPHLISGQNSEAGFETSSRDSIANPVAFLNIARNPQTGTCRIDAGLVASNSDSEFAPLVTLCTAILATTSLTVKQATWFIVLLGGSDQAVKTVIVAAQGGSVREAPDLEQRVAVAATNRRILEVKDALRKIVDAP